jgi:hypothetical protein
MIMEVERRDKVERYMQFWDATGQEHRLPLSQQQFLLAFGSETGHRNALDHSGLNITIDGQKLTYDSFDHSFRRYSHIRWSIKYDTQDLSHVLAVNEDNSLQFLLEQKYVQPMALVERQEGDTAELQRVYTFNKQLESAAAQEYARLDGCVTEFLNENPHLELKSNVLAKHLITDSNGQHKDQRNAIRRSGASVKDVLKTEDYTPFTDVDDDDDDILNLL